VGKYVFAIVIAVFCGIIGLTMFPSIRTTIKNNFPVDIVVANYSFETNDPPDDWTLVGAGATFTRSDTQHYLGNYSGKVVTAGAISAIRQDITSYPDFAGKMVKYSAWVWSSVVGVQLILNDGVTNYGSNGHTGSGNWELLTVTAQMDSNPTFLRVIMYVYTLGATVYIDDVTMQGGLAIPEVEASPLLKLAQTSLPYLLAFFVVYAIYLGYRRNKGG
jgi:hypothetical protein